MESLTNFLNTLGDNYSLFISFLAILLLIWGIYNDIKFRCLSKANKFVSDVEEKTELTGEEKFELCLSWINEDLPKIFRNSLVQSLVKKLISFAYETSFEYMKKYVKRKTGVDISELVEQFKETIE